jgi:hypothetical protein
LYALIPAFLPLTKAPLIVTFCNSPQLSRSVGLNLFNVIKSTTFHCFLQFWEQEVSWRMVRGVGRVWERQNVVFRQKFFCGYSPVGRGIVMVQDPNATAPLLRAKSAHSVMEALQDCFVEFLIYRLSSRDIVMMNQPIIVEERNQHGLVHKEPTSITAHNTHQNCVCVLPPDDGQVMPETCRGFKTRIKVKVKVKCVSS